MSDAWYFARNGRDRQGPFTLNQLRQFAGAGSVQACDMAWQEGTRCWVSVGSLQLLGLDASQVNTPVPTAANSNIHQDLKQFMAPAMCGLHMMRFSIQFRWDAAIGWLAFHTYKRPAAPSEKRYPPRAFRGCFRLGGRYSGCPYCKDLEFFQCGNCGMLNCQARTRIIDGETTAYFCASCNAEVIGKATDMKEAMGAAEV